MINIHSVPLRLHAKSTERKGPLHETFSSLLCIGVNPLHYQSKTGIVGGRGHLSSPLSSEAVKWLTQKITVESRQCKHKNVLVN